MSAAVEEKIRSKFVATHPGFPLRRTPKIFVLKCLASSGPQNRLSQLPNMQAWIQKENLESVEFEAPDSTAARRVLREVDWTWTCEPQVPGDIDPPGLGLMAGDGHILQIFPDAEGQCMVHFHFPNRVKVLGLIPWTVQEVRTVTGISLGDAETMVESMFRGEYRTLMTWR